MNDKKDEALKLALEALEKIGLRGWVERKEDAITAIREAQAEQPAQQQEPVAYASDVEFDDETEIIPAEQKGRLGTAGLRIPLYTSPQPSKPWVGLTDAEWMNIVNKDHAWFGQRPEDVAHEVAKLVEAKLKEKNT